MLHHLLRLARLRQLHGRLARYRDKDLDPRTVGRELSVDARFNALMR